MAKEIKVSVFVSEELHEKLKALAKSDGRTLARYAENVLKTHVERKARAA